MRNTTFRMNVKGIEYEVFNGTAGDCVIVEEVATGKKMVIKESGTYANKSAVRNSLVKYLAKHEVEPEVTEDEMVTRAEYEAEMMAEMQYEHEMEVEMEMEHEVEEPEEVTEEEIVKTINDVIYRNLPKYVQKAIDYCDYVDGVYRIHVNTEFGNKEIEADKWADASLKVKNFCKTGEL